MSIGSVGEEDFDEVEVKKAGRDDGKKDVAHLEEVQVAINDQPSHAGEQDNRPCDGEEGIGLSYGVKVDDRTPVATFRADVDHFGEAVGIQFELDDVSLDGRCPREYGRHMKSSRSKFMGTAEKRSNCRTARLWHGASHPNITKVASTTGD